MKDHVSKKLVWLGLALALTLALSSGASAQPGEFVKGVLQPLADGFPNRAITLVVIDDPGSRDGFLARNMQEGLNGISPVPIRVSDEPLAVGGTFDKMVEIKGREGGKVGYYVIATDYFGAATDPLCYDIEKELGTTIEDLNGVIVTDRQTRIVLQRKNAPWGLTFASLVKYVKENPGKVTFTAPGVGTGSDIAFSAFLAHVGILDKVRKVPAANIKESNTIVAAGMGDFCIGRMDTAIPHMQGDKVDVIMFTSPVPPPWNKNPNIVSWEQAVPGQAGTDLRNLGDYVLGWSVSKEAPRTHMDWLFKLFKAGASTDSYKKRETTFPGNYVGNFLGPDECKAMVKKMYTDSEPIIRQLGLHWDQQK
jgi:tripartite-type tricarboxylate transporter receptor subunit TctC